MSNDPFQTNNPQRGGSQPFGNDGGFPGQPQAPPKKKTWLWVLLIVAGLGFVSLVICCGVGAFGVSKFGAVVFEPVRNELNQLEQVQASAGQIDKLSMNFGATVKEAESYPDFIILDAETADGPRQFSVKLGDEAAIEAAYLIQADGTREELDLNAIGNQPPPQSSDSASPMNSPMDSNPNESNPAGAADAVPMDATEKELRELESALDLE